MVRLQGPGAHRPYLVVAMELSPYLIEGPQGGFFCCFNMICCGGWLESLHYHCPMIT